jgi:hypothetical protein
LPTDLDPISVLARTDPAAGRPVPERPALEELAALPVVAPARPSRGRLVVLAAAGLLVVLLAGAAVVLATDDPGSTPPATEPGPTTTRPPLPDARPAPLDLAPGTPARADLLALAEVAAADTTPAPEGSVAYSRRVGIVSETTVDDGRATVAYLPYHEETWIEPDGALHRRDADFPPVQDGAEIQIDPALDPPEGEITPAGSAEPGVLDRPVDVAGVTADLLSQQGGGPAGRAALERFAEVLGGQPLTGAQRAALYVALASIDGVEHRGEVRDRAGRTGIAFSYTTDDSGARSESIVVVDPGRGTLLQTESVMLESAPAIPIDEPLVKSYRVVLVVAAVSEPGERP